VAVKEILCPAPCAEAERQAVCRRAIREARLASWVSHRNVIRVLDIVEEQGCPWIVMEFVPCRSLHGVLEQRGRLDPAEAAWVGLDVLAALRAVHAHGIVHRDVKPANILVAPDRVVLTDFGIAQLASGSPQATSGTLVGSPPFVAPERARGGESGPPDDLWGLGALLYASVEGHDPFDQGGGGLATLTAVLTDELAPAPHAGKLWPVIGGLLRKDPRERLSPAEAEPMLLSVLAMPGRPAAALSTAEAGSAVLRRHRPGGGDDAPRATAGSTPGGRAVPRAPDREARPAVARPRQRLARAPDRGGGPRKRRLTASGTWSNGSATRTVHSRGSSLPHARRPVGSAASVGSAPSRAVALSHQLAGRGRTRTGIPDSGIRAGQCANTSDTSATVGLQTAQRGWRPPTSWPPSPAGRGASPPRAAIVRGARRNPAFISDRTC
jgi:eukaryotic-like serine/threonine-protein kinase